MNCPEQFAHCDACGKIFNLNFIREQNFETIDEDAEDPANKYKITGVCPGCGKESATSLRKYENEKCIKAFNHAQEICNDQNGCSGGNLYAKAFALGMMMEHRQLQGEAVMVLLRVIQAYAKLEQHDVRNRGAVELCKLASEPLERKMGTL